MNDVPIIKPVPAGESSSNPRISLNILGQQYDHVIAISNNNIDSIYLGAGSNPKKRIIRIKYQHEIFEVIP